MAKKKKKSIDLTGEGIFFTIEQREYKALRFYPSTMCVDVMEFVDGKKQPIENIPFAHLPKQTKQTIKPKK